MFSKRNIYSFNVVTCNALFVVVGSLIKLVYFCGEDSGLEKSSEKSVGVEGVGLVTNSKNYPFLNGKLHFAKFETSKINECLDFIESNLHGSRMILFSPDFSLLSYVFIM